MNQTNYGGAMRSLKLIFIFSLITSFVFAGGVVKVHHTGDESGTSKMFVQDNMLRLESNIGGESNITIFDSEKHVLYHLNVPEKTYIAITKDDMAKVGKKMNAALKLLEEQMKKLPKEQQEMMKEMMKGNVTDLGTQEVEKTEFNKVESGVTVGKWTCDKYVGKIKGEKVEEVWVTPWKNTSLSDEYQSAFSSLKSFFEDLREQVGPLARQMPDKLDTWFIENGVPVKSVSYNGEKVTSTVEVDEIIEKNLNSTLFAVPSDYSKENPFDIL